MQKILITYDMYRNAKHRATIAIANTGYHARLDQLLTGFIGEEVIRVLFNSEIKNREGYDFILFKNSPIDVKSMQLRCIPPSEHQEFYFYKNKRFESLKCDGLIFVMIYKNKIAYVPGWLSRQKINEHAEYVGWNGRRRYKISIKEMWSI